MKSQDMVFFAKGNVYFPSGKIDPDTCTVSDFDPIVGNVPAAVSGHLNNQLVYPNSLGTLRLLLDPTGDGGEKAAVLMFSIELSQPVHLIELIKKYDQEPKFIVEEMEDENGESEMVYTAMFSPNFGVQFDLETKMISTFVFAKMGHILTCPCQSCFLIRQQFELPQPG